MMYEGQYLYFISFQTSYRQENRQTHFQQITGTFETFCQHIEIHDFTDIISEGDVNKAYNTFLWKLTIIYENCFSDTNT